MSITRKPARLWLDLETTHLDEMVGSIIEIGCVVADSDHNELAAYESAILPDEGGRWSEWCLTHHQVSGLLAEALRARPLAVVLADLDLWLSVALPAPVPLAGCSPQFDRAWLRTHIRGYGLPDILRHVTHQQYDVSTLLAEARDTDMVQHDLAKDPNPAPHRALADCRRALHTAQRLRQWRNTRP